MNNDEIKERMQKLREALAAVPDGDPSKAVLSIGLELLEGFLINQANSTFFLEELYTGEHMRRINA